MILLNFYGLRGKDWSNFIYIILKYTHLFALFLNKLEQKLAVLYYSQNIFQFFLLNYIYSQLAPPWLVKLSLNFYESSLDLFSSSNYDYTKMEEFGI